jgi:hypothetical protein
VTRALFATHDHVSGLGGRRGRSRRSAGGGGGVLPDGVPELVLVDGSKALERLAVPDEAEGRHHIDAVDLRDFLYVHVRTCRIEQRRLTAAHVDVVSTTTTTTLTLRLRACRRSLY